MRDGVRYIEYIGAPIYILPANLSEFKTEKKGKYWYNISRMEAKFTEEIGPLQFELLTDPLEIKPWLPLVHELFCSRWGHGITSSPWKTKQGFETYAEALLDLAQAKEANLAILHSNGSLLAFSYNLIDRSRFYFYQHAATTDLKLAKYSLGKIFLIHLLRKIIESGHYRVFDFMIGESSYKLEWASCIQKVYLAIETQKFKSKLGFWAHFFKASAKGYIQRSETIKNLIRSAAYRLRSIV
jgi:CelD/BcsL family acetyltransferase involved in cellulose biosynthesis